MAWKKISRHSGALLAASIVFSSCSGNHAHEEEVIRVINESLENSNQVINMDSRAKFMNLKNKAADIATQNKAGIWLPKAEQILEKSSVVFNFIDALKESDKIDQIRSDSLYRNLLKYKKTILALDTSIRFEFSKRLNLVSRSFNIDSSDAQIFRRTFFEHSNWQLTKAMLTKIQNDIRIIENNTISFCNENVSAMVDRFDRFSAIVAQNRSVLQAGEKIEITAGVGSFSKNSNPEIMINGKMTELNGEGISLFKTPVAGKPGKYSIPVIISYTDPYGKRQTQKFTVEYTIVKPCDQ